MTYLLLATHSPIVALPLNGASPPQLHRYSAAGNTTIAFILHIAISQNAKQNPNAEYSYTQYDSIGRIYQVGELTNSTAMSAATSRNAASLLTWLNGVSSTMEQITQTVYDYEYSPLEPELYAQNLRNRVAYTSYYALQSDISSSTPTQATTTYYSYDILGNVDTLVQDYHYGVMNSTNNRFKKIVYNYDLQSGKVDQVAYQHGSADAFYHTYAYDAENRLTNVQTSADSINWDNDAFYSYYLHGPLARTVLGDQQVQGLNYAYTLQGWMKAINPPVYSATGYNLIKDGSSGTPVGSNAYNLLLNYYQGDDSLVSGATGADVSLNLALGTSYRPLYNGNISSMGVNVAALTNPLLYNYQYDQLNRIVHMDAWNNTGATWANSSKLSDFEEAVTYDPNGNILTYSRNGNNTFAGSPLAMDNLTYNYTTGTNKLDHIADAVSSSNYPNDIDNQSSGNYSYDAIGELTADNASSITGITWTVYGKINTISKSGGISISFTYDAAGNRISKSYNNGSTTIVTWYVRDAQGNVLSVYTSGDATINSGDLSQTESDLYGSSRLGMLKSATDVYNLATVTPTTLPLLGQGYPLIFTRGNKLFELSNHLGNVLATISDKKLGISTDGSTVDHFNPQVLDANDYYPFGSLEPGRTYAAASVGNYRYGFNGKEDDNEVKGVGDEIDYGMRGYDPRVGRFLCLDPIKSKYPELTPYQYASNRPIDGVDQDGKEWAAQSKWINVGTPNFALENDLVVKVKVINKSTIVTNQQDIQLAAERYKSAIERKFSTTTIVDLSPVFGIPFKIKVNYKTVVVLDFTPLNPDDGAAGRLVFDDRKSTNSKVPSIVNNSDGSTTNITTTYTSSVPGDTKGIINSFTTNIAITMDGKEVNLDGDFDMTSQHEGGHSASLNHPWQLSEAEEEEIPELDPASNSNNPVLIKRNLMNSAENTDKNTNANDGSELLLKQLDVLFKNIKSKSIWNYNELIPSASSSSSTPSSQTNNSSAPTVH